MNTVLHAVLGAASKTGSGNALVSLLPILLIGVVFYFLLIRPQQRRARTQRELIQSVDEGDEVVTIGGIFGVVRDIEDDSVLLEVAPGTELRFLRSAIARKLQSQEDDRNHDQAGGQEAERGSAREPDDELGTDSGAGGKT